MAALKYRLDELLLRLFIERKIDLINQVKHRTNDACLIRDALWEQCKNEEGLKDVTKRQIGDYLENLFIKKLKIPE